MESKIIIPSILERLIINAFCEGELTIQESGVGFNLIARKNGMVMRLASVARTTEDDAPAAEELMLNEISLSVQRQKREQLLGTELDQASSETDEVKPRHPNLRLVQ